MTIRYGANGMPMKPKEDEMLSEILEVNPNKKEERNGCRRYSRSFF
jgi:hypothetical protein